MSQATEQHGRKRLSGWALFVGLLVLLPGAGITQALLNQENFQELTPGPQLTEIVASNGLTLIDEDGDSPDWFEIKNPHDYPIALNSYAIVTNRGDFWALPSRLLEPGGHLAIFASGKDRNPIDGELHTNFRLPQSGGFLGVYGLTEDDVLDSVVYPHIPRNASFGLAADSWCFFAFPTPHEANHSECFSSPELGRVIFSLPGGFYDDSVTLELASNYPDREVFFTLDGSYPDPNTNPNSTLIYREPIHLENRTPEPAKWALVDSTIPNEHVPSAIPQPLPEGDIPKVTTVRARLADGQESTETFFIGLGSEDFAIPVLSLTVDGDCLFDPATGIYVAGETFLRALEEGRFDPLDPGPRPLPANYRNRGSQYECPADRSQRNSAWVQSCEPNGGCFEAEPSRIRIHGGWTRTNPQKSLRLYANNDVGGNQSFPNIAKFNNDFENYRNLILRMAGGNTWTHWDDFLQSLVSDLDFDIQSSESAAVFLNGEYWGLYNIRHRYDRHFVAERHGVDADKVQMLGNLFTVQEGPEDSHRHFRAILTHLWDNDPSDPAVMDVVYENIDVDQFYDFVALNLFVSNGDWPHNNVRIWREAPPEAEPTLDADGSPWRFLVFDLDSGSLRGNILNGRFQIPEDRRDQGGYPYLFHRLMESETEQAKFLNRISDLLNSNFHPSITLPRHQEFVDRVAPEMGRQIERWGRPESLQSWRDFIAEKNERLQDRPDEQRQILADWFSLDGFGPISVEIPQQGGTVSVNSLVLDTNSVTVGPTNLWTGKYFRGIPIKLGVSPETGYQLSHWLLENSDGEQSRMFEENISIDVHDYTLIRPVLLEIPAEN